MVKIRLHYFDVRGRGEAIRKLLHYKKVPFEDIRYSREEWPQKKSDFKYGQVPALEVDGKFLYETNAIIRYLARKYDLEGKDEWETAQLDEINELLNEFHEEIMPYILVSVGIIPGDKEKLYQEKVIPAVGKYFPHFEKALKDAGTGFFAKSGVTYMDFIMSEGSERTREMNKELLEDYPLFAKHGPHMHSLPELREYLKVRTPH